MSGFQYARNWRILLLGPSPALGEGLKSLLSQEIPLAVLFEVKAYPDAPALPQLLTSQNLSLCLLDVSSKPEVAIPLIREMQTLAPRLPIIAVLSSDEPDQILACLRQGAADFLPVPASPAHLSLVFTKVLQAYPELAPSSACARTIAVMPAKGACGASTVALNLAFQRKRLGAKRVLLADLDPLTGTLAFQLRAKPTYSFLDAMNRGDLDQDVWRGLVQHVDGVDVLYAPDAITEALYNLGDPAPMVEFARGCYDLIIMDLASAYGPWNGRLAQLADEVLLVTTGDPGGLRSAQRSLLALRNHQTPEGKVRILVNRHHKARSLGTDVFETALQKQLLLTLPADVESIQRALIDAKPVAAGAPFAKGILALADALAGPKPPAPEGKPAAKPGALSGLLALFGKKATL
jgi:pilus assembly protein CpaE